MKIQGTFQGGLQNDTPTVDVPFTNDLGLGSYASSLPGAAGTYGMANWVSPTQKVVTISMPPMETYTKSVDIPVYWQATGYMNVNQGGSENDTDRNEL